MMWRRNTDNERISAHYRSAACGLWTVLFLGFSSLPVCAGPVLNDPEMWTNSPSLSGWTNALPYGTELATLSNPSNYLRITFSEQTEGPEFETDTIYADSGNYVGGYQEGGLLLALRFDFYAEDVLPLTNMVYLHSAVSNTTWEYVFTYTNLGTWVTYEVPFSYDAGWFGPGGETEFWDDLANIDRIGITIARDWPNTIQQDYGIDNWEYYIIIPEPGTLGVLATAFLSLGVMFRRRRKSRT